MHPDRASRLLANFGILLILVAISLRIISLSSAEPPEPVPSIGAVRGQFVIIPGSDDIFFQESRGEGSEVTGFSAPVDGGLPRPDDPPWEEDTLPFVIREDEIFIASGNGTSFATGSLPDEQVVDNRISPDGKSIAFISSRSGQEAFRLYVLTSTGDLTWLGEGIGLTGLAWSADGEHLAFFAPVNGVSQLFIMDRSGKNLRQLTNTTDQKSDAAWAGNGSFVAYLGWWGPESSPPPGSEIMKGNDVYAADLPGVPASLNEGPEGELPEPRQLTDSMELKYGLVWSPENETFFYATIPIDYPRETRMMGITTIGETRQVYPPLTIERFDCPTRFTRGETENIQIVLSSSGRRGISAPVILRVGADLPEPGVDPSVGAAWVERFDFPPGGVIEVERPVHASAGLFTYVWVGIDAGQALPFDEAVCSSLNTYLGLPALPFLPVALPLVLPGMILCLPYLLRKKKRLLWGCLAAVPVVLAVLIAVETAAWGLS